MAENGNSKSNNSKSEKYNTKNCDLNEISPLKCGVEQNISTNIDIPLAKTDNDNESKKHRRFKDTFNSTLTHMDITQKARLPFMFLIVICALLILTLIVLIATWPRIESYMKSDVCVKKECLDASAQLLLWANTSADICQNPYNWACGKFDDEYVHHEFYGINGGEWNVQTDSDFQEIAEIHSFVAKLSSAALTSSAQLMLKGLHQACMGLEMLDKSESDSTLKNAIFSLLGWIYGETYDHHIWDFKQAMIKSHSQYGLSPFFKISVKNRDTPPFGNIITISEGEIGLPDKMFYQLDFHHRITTGYQMLMRDFAINMGVVSDKATKFAEQMYHFEKRIVTVIKSKGAQDTIMSLKDVQTIAPSLPIFETITTTFSHTKITEETMVLVRDVETLRQMSIIVSTTDELPLNSFITWSLSRRYLPFMSREYRAALEEFENVLYGILH